jgi:hypothetical protein
MPPLPMQYRGKSPDSFAALSAAGALVRELEEMVYRHSLQKFTSRVNKRYKKFRDFIRALKDYVGKRDLNQLPHSHLWQTLGRVAGGIWSVEALLRAHTATTLPFVDLINKMSAMASLIKMLVQSPSVSQWPLLVPGKLKHSKMVGIWCSHLTSNRRKRKCLSSRTVSPESKRPPVTLYGSREICALATPSPALLQQEVHSQSHSTNSNNCPQAAAKLGKSGCRCPRRSRVGDRQS